MVENVTNPSADYDEIGLLEKIFNFLVGKNPDPQLPALKTIQKQMVKAGYKYYNVGKEKILADFVKSVFQIYEAIAPLREFFLIRNEDTFYEECIIHAFMSENQLKMEEVLCEPSIRAAAKKMSFNDLRDRCQKAFAVLKKEFTKNQYAKIISMNTSVSILRHFCVFDFYAMLKKFCYDLKENSFTEKYKFSSMSREYFEPEVTDLLTNIANLLVMEDWSGILEFLKDIPGYKDFDTQKFNDMFTNLKNMNQENVFSDFGKLFFHDSKWEFKNSIKQKDILKPYLEKQEQQLKVLILDIFNKKRTERIENLKMNIFGNLTLSPLKNYNTSFSELLLAAKSPAGYTLCNQMTYFHVFCESVLTPLISTFVDVFSVRAVSSDSKYTSQMASEFHAVIELDATMIKLDTQLGSSFPRGYKIVSMLDNKGKQEILTKLEVEVNSVNAEFEKILTQAQVLFKLINDKLNNLLLDESSSTHVLIKNWGEMDHFFSVPVVPSLSRISKNIENFVALIDCYN